MSISPNDETQVEAQAQSELDTSEETLERQPTPELPKRALVIVAHPDDAEFGCCATAAKWVRDGWEVSFCIVTDASGGGDDHATDVGPAARKVIADTRKAEQRAAAEVLGRRSRVPRLSRWPDRADARIAPRHRARHAPPAAAIVVSPSPDRRWDPYSSVGITPTTWRSASPPRPRSIPPPATPGISPNCSTRGCCRSASSELWIVGAPISNHYVDVSETVDAKIEALRAHQSQLGEHMRGSRALRPPRPRHDRRPPRRRLGRGVPPRRDGMT